MTHLEMKGIAGSEAMENRKTDALFFKLYDQYGSAVYRNICNAVDDKALAKEILFRAFLQMHRTINELPADNSQVLNWMIKVSQNVCTEYFAELYGERRCC